MKIITKKSNKILIKIKAFSLNILKLYLKALPFIVQPKTLNYKALPTIYKQFTVLRSPHKYRKAQEHYQLKIYQSILIYENISPAIFLNLIKNKPKGVHIVIKIKQI